MESTPDQVASITNNLQTGISSSTSAPIVTDENLQTLDKYLERLPLSRSVLSVSTRCLLDVSGTRLWNSCVQALAVCDASKQGVLSKVAFFSFNMLESAAPRRGPGNWRMLEIALMAAKCCLENEHLESSLKALEVAAVRLDSLEKSEPSDKLKLSAITTKYYMLRIYLGRPDIAEHFFKISKPLEHLDARKIIVEICCAIGLSALSKSQPDVSLTWLERALHPSLWFAERTDLALKDMRLLSLHAFVRAHLRLNIIDWKHVYNGMSSLQSESQFRLQFSNGREKHHALPVTLLQLEVFSREEQPNYDKYSECLRTLIQAMDVTEECLRMVLYHAKKISSWSIEVSIQTFQHLLLDKILPSRNEALINHCFVTFVWTMTDTDKCIQHDLDTISSMLSSLTNHGYSPLGEEASHASLVLIWRRIEHAVSAHDFLIAEKWCLIALEQPLFEYCCTANKAIFQRKYLLCAIESRSLITHTSLCEILQRFRDTSSTVYLVYKIALLHGYNDLAATALNLLS